MNKRIEIELASVVTEDKVDCLRCGATNDVTFRQGWKDGKPSGRETASAICWKCGKHVGMSRRKRIQ